MRLNVRTKFFLECINSYFITSLYDKPLQFVFGIARNVYHNHVFIFENKHRNFHNPFLQENSICHNGDYSVANPCFTKSSEANIRLTSKLRINETMHEI